MSVGKNVPLLQWKISAEYDIRKVENMLLNKIKLLNYLKRVYAIVCHTCLCANVIYVPVCLRASVVYVPMCQKYGNFSFLRANVPTCHTACQCFNLVCQRAKSMSIFQAFLLWNVEWNFSTLILYRKFYILLDIIVIHIICICIVIKNCIILHFHTSCHIKQECEEFFLFYYFFLFWSLVRN